MPQYTEKPTLITHHFTLREGTEAVFVDWQAKLNAKVIVYPGFVSLEFLSPSNAQKGWLVVQRLSNAAAAAHWRNSEPFRILMDELKSLTVNGDIHETLNDESCFREGVTEVIVTRANPDKETEYREWSAKIHQAEAKFAGFRGVYVQSPDQTKGGHWITLLQFDSMENLDKWLESPERQKLLDESTSLVSSLETHRMVSPYSGWFASIAKVAELPPVWKQTMIVLLVLFPIVMLELKYLSPLIQDFNPSMATFIGNAISVTLISFPMMPLAIYFLGWWLAPEKKQQRRATIIGTILVIAIYIIEIALFWNS